MNHTTKTRISFIIVLITCSFLMQSFVQPKEEKDDKPTNLKVLPKNMSKEEVISLMKVYSKSSPPNGGSLAAPFTLGNIFICSCEVAQ